MPSLGIFVLLTVGLVRRLRPPASLPTEHHGDSGVPERPASEAPPDYFSTSQED